MNRRPFKTTLTGWALCAGLLLTGAVADAQLAIRGGKILTMAGDPLDSGVILIRDGRIEAVGADLEIPVEYKVIDATGQVIMPGFIDIHNASAMSQANERNANVPFLTVLDTINPEATYFEECRRNGITTAAVVPGNSTMIGGQAAVLKTAGKFVNDMAVEKLVGIKLSMQPPQGSRMSQIAALRRELNKAKDKKAGESKDSSESEAADEASESSEEAGGEEGDSENADQGNAPNAAQTQQGLDVLAKLIGGEILAYIYCENAMDVGQAIRLIDEFELRPVMVLGKDCDKAVKLLADRKYPVVLDSDLVFWRENPRTREEEKISLPRIFHDAGLEYMFQADSNPSRTTLGSNYLWYQAAVAVKDGLPKEASLLACTLLPAKTLGIDGIVGSIEVGKDADLVILTGDPLATRTWVSQTIIRGEVVYDRANDERLKRLLESPKQ